ncbi:hypothetical protein [Marinobacter sp. S6332]|uniref:hypothetical protein n=1 Tax=Marinobacter sp. S6332 TaxID=2926403 RepID=UPI001FF2DF0D|nr:hypothetical protein [Marinobacter sp. S6332]MCK0165869.1 hypothetical protein [Marinobacter sp. S6332]
MTDQNLFHRVGGAHQVTLSEPPEAEGCLLLDRRLVSSFSPELEKLMTGPLVITVSPDRPALQVYSGCKWEFLQPRIAALPHMNRDARKLQRVMLGNACSFDESEPVVIPRTLVRSSSLGPQGILVSFDADFSELWSAHELAN